MRPITALQALQELIKLQAVALSPLSRRDLAHLMLCSQASVRQHSGIDSPGSYGHDFRAGQKTSGGAQNPLSSVCPLILLRHRYVHPNGCSASSGSSGGPPPTPR